MAMVQNSRPHPERDQTLLKMPLKRMMREKPTEAGPIKKRVMAALNLSCKQVSEPPLSLSLKPVVKTERVEYDPSFLGCGHSGFQRDSKVKDGRDGALDLSPALRHTLAQFTLSSQCSLGGPAAFSEQHSQDKLAPSLSQGGVPTGPLLVPPDSSTELTLCNLEGESISCFSVGGELRLCLPQVLNTVLRAFSLQQINSVCDQLYVYCSRCDASQLHVLKALGILPPGAPSCGLITLTDAQWLCNTLLHPGDAAPVGSFRGLGDGKEEEEEEEEERDVKEGGGFWVEHKCLGKCQGLFVPRLYSGPNAPCIRCSQCRRLFCPERFVLHSHRQPNKRTCHWGFDSAKWVCYLQLGRRHHSTADEDKLKQQLEAMKIKFNGLGPQVKDPLPEMVQVEEELNLCPGSGKLCEGSTEGKTLPLPAYVFDPCLLPGLKEDPGHLDVMWQSWYLYMQEKLALSAGCLAAKDVEVLRAEALDSLLKKGARQDGKRAAQDGDGIDPKTSDPAGNKKTSCLPGQSEHDSPDEWPRVSIETVACEKPFSGGLEENKDRMVVEVLQMYNTQHEKLQSTLRRQQQLERELKALRRNEVAEQRHLQGELEVVQTEHAQKLGEVQEEQKRLKCKLEQLRQQSCRCREQQRAEEQQETHYATQLSELRQRLDRAEEDREELQEQLRREREARQMLERTIAELKQQMKESVSTSTLDSPFSNSTGDMPLSPAL